MYLQKLTLYTPNLEKTIDFYGHTLKFPLLIKSLQSATFKIGKTRLTFTRKENAKPYHFAINIPSNKENEVLNWLREKARIIMHNNQEMIDWPDWNAKAIYIYDHDNNVVEFIARKNLGYTESMPFIPTQILGVSEIGMAVNDVQDTLRKLNRAYKLPVFSKIENHFCAAGDENGMFIIIDKNMQGWFPNNDKAHTSDFVLQQEDGKNIRFINGEVMEF